jgi:hypothetical protein
MYVFIVAGGAVLRSQQCLEGAIRVSDRALSRQEAPVDSHTFVLIGQRRRRRREKNQAISC